MALRKRSTRIPTFGSRIPFPSKAQAPALLPPGTTTQSDTITILGQQLTQEDVERKVRVNEIEGTLKFIGNVQFAQGIWCGVQVEQGSGKNDGSVQGIRYFSCPKTCGLMAPLSKVQLLDDLQQEDLSGPYSMLFGVKDHINNETNTTPTILRSRTFDKFDEKEIDRYIEKGEKEELSEEVNNKINPVMTMPHRPSNNELMNETFVAKRSFVLENLLEYESFIATSKMKQSSPMPTQKQALDDDSNKRDSLEFEESLGILTPDQMPDISALDNSRPLSSDNQDESSMVEYSLGLIDLSNLKTDAMILPLDIDSKNLIRIEQTPSPEDLPLDPTPIKVEPKKTVNSFITSITSITSLDTGYQGDGEMSRPASRGADNSPLTRRPQPRSPPRRADPMTDSDFYTESDADNHEEHPLRGDRRAQVIDGTLYGVDPQAAADIYVNNRENMDSSGVFTDIERELSSADNNVELSPSDSSTKTISDDSQTNVNLSLNKTIINETILPAEKTPTKTPTSPVISSPASSVRSPRHIPKTKDPSKNYKMPKRNVASKVKAMIEPNNKENEKRTTIAKKSNGKWDAVMNKISKSTTDNTKNLKDVKPKIFTAINTNTQRNSDTNLKLIANNQKNATNKVRRVRTRATAPTQKNTESINSSLSDLSGASPAKKNGSVKKQRDVLRVTQVLTATKLSPKSNNGHTLTATEAKNKAKLTGGDVKASNRTIFSSNKEKKKETVKEISRAAVKGGRVSPGARPPQPPQATLKPPAPRTAEALAILVQHLVFNLEAFKNPGLKKEVAKMRVDVEEARLSCHQLEETLLNEKQQHSDVVNEERLKYRSEIAQLIEKHRHELLKVKEEYQEAQSIYEHEKETMRCALNKQHEEQMRNVRVEFERLQKSHGESLDILREENDAIREEMDEKNEKIKQYENFKSESEKLLSQEKRNAERLIALQDEVNKLREENEELMKWKSGGVNSFQEVQSLRVVVDLRQSEICDLRKALAEASQKADLLPGAEEKIAVLNAKCEDLQHQLERKNDYESQLIMENKKLHDSFKEEINQKKRLQQHNEELQWKLQQNKEVVTKVLEEAEASAFTRSMLSASFNERHASAQKHSLERTLSFRERSLSNKSNTSNSQCSRKSKNSFDYDDVSPPSSPKVKGVVEKSDSVSYVLEMDERPEVVASRIVRRSFRNATPPKNTPTKSPSNKRPRMKNNLSLSASTSAIVTENKTESLRSRSASIRNEDDNADDIFVWEAVPASTPVLNKKLNKHYWGENGDYDEDLDDIKLPVLPSEIGRNKDRNTLPLPKHLAGEAMISESNSEDESSTSSSSGQL